MTNARERTLKKIVLENIDVHKTRSQLMIKLKSMMPQRESLAFDVLKQVEVGRQLQAHILNSRIGGRRTVLHAICPRTIIFVT